GSAFHETEEKQIPRRFAPRDDNPCIFQVLRKCSPEKSGSDSFFVCGCRATITYARVDQRGTFQTTAHQTCTSTALRRSFPAVTAVSSALTTTASNFAPVIALILSSA